MRPLGHRTMTNTYTQLSMPRWRQVLGRPRARPAQPVGTAAHATEQLQVALGVIGRGKILLCIASLCIAILPLFAAADCLWTAEMCMTMTLAKMQVGVPQNISIVPNPCDAGPGDRRVGRVGGSG